MASESENYAGDLKRFALSIRNLWAAKIKNIIQTKGEIGRFELCQMVKSQTHPSDLCRFYDYENCRNIRRGKKSRNGITEVSAEAKIRSAATRISLFAVHDIVRRNGCFRYPADTKEWSKVMSSPYMSQQLPTQTKKEANEARCMVFQLTKEFLKERKKVKRSELHIYIKNKMPPHLLIRQYNAFRPTMTALPPEEKINRAVTNLLALVLRDHEFNKAAKRNVEGRNWTSVRWTGK